MDKKSSQYTVAIATLGCKVNQCDSAAMAESLTVKGYRLVSFKAPADVYIINTCVVTGSTEAQSRQLVRRALKKNPRAKILVTGCYAQKAAADLSNIGDRVHIAGNREKKDIALYVDKLLKDDFQGASVADIAGEKLFSTPASSHFFDRTRAFLKIQDGCNSRCSYCIVPAVRGISRSLAPAEAVSRFNCLVESGYREIVLTGIHLGAYGLDLTPPTSITDLLHRLEAARRSGSVRIRLSSLEPTEFSEELICFLKHSSSVCPHFHIPLQSGAAQILKKMRRPYTPDFFKQLIEMLTACIPDVNIGIDVIAGFPGETDVQFQETVKLLQSVFAGYLHVFPYSRRPGTPAARFAGHIAEHEKKKRVQVLRQISREKKNRFYTTYINKTLGVLVEGKRVKGTDLFKGFSRNYIPVLFEGSPDMIGREVAVRVQEVRGEMVYGTIIR